MREGTRSLLDDRFVPIGELRGLGPAVPVATHESIRIVAFRAVILAASGVLRTETSCFLDIIAPYG